MSNGDPGLHLDERINIRGELEAIHATMTEREKRLEDYKASVKEALKLQAEEYTRRLHDLNGEYKRDRERQQDYVRVDKYEDKLKADEEKFKRESEAREKALLRVDEKFDEYVRRYEQDKRDIQVLLAAQKAAVEAAERAADKHSVEQKEKVEAASRRTTRNLQLMGLGLAIFVFAANFLPALIN